MKVSAFTLAPLVLASTCSTFSPIARRSARQLVALNNAEGREAEKVMRKALEETFLEISETKALAVADGANMERAYNPDMSTTTDSSTSPGDHKGSLQATMERMIKARAYPLFLAEKIMEIAESTVQGVLGKKGESENLMNAGAEREKIVVLGSGWGAATFLKEIDADKYDVTIISPRNYFLFTPMLPGASVGTVEFQSITQPVRELNRKANFLESVATRIDPATQIVECESVVCDGNSCEIDSFQVTYDRLVVTIGAQTNTFGIPGVKENCCFLKQVEDARRIRTAIVNCFERANLPNLTDEGKRSTLTFAVIGAGPTGVELSAELRDFIEQDGPKYYPDLLKYVSIEIIEASSTVLAPFDKNLQEEAIRQMKRTVNFNDPKYSGLLPPDYELVKVRLGCSVKEVTANTIYLNDGQDIKYGLCVWAAGNGPLPLTLQTIDALGEEQKMEQDVARGRLAIDPWLRVIGGEGKILSFGDCSCITCGQLPATAQVALQQGEFLASLFNKNYIMSPPRSEGIFPPPKKHPGHASSLSEVIAGFAIQSTEYARPFQFWNLGILAYTGGGSALAQVAVAPKSAPVKSTGKLGNTLWKGVYLTKQVSWRNRLLVLNDWFRRQVFGRDITRL